MICAHFQALADGARAFDNVPRHALWQKLLRANVRGKMFNVIYCLYDSIKSCVKSGDKYSAFFNCNIGIRQGENLSPFLFALYLNDIESYFIANDVESLKIIENFCISDLDIFLKMFVLLYADDTIIMAESAENLQYALGVFGNYCKIWGLNVNLSKTKIIIFSRRKSRIRHDFKIFEKSIEVHDFYTYLGVVFNYNCSFKMAKQTISEQTQKLLFMLYRKLRNIPLPVDLQLKLFDTLILPAQLYGCEIWGFGNNNVFEKTQLQFCKHILKLRSSTPNYMIYGELGRIPVYITIKLRMACFWNKLIQNTSKLSGIMYKVMLYLSNTKNFEFTWINYVKSIFDNAGLSYLWLQQMYIEPEYLKHILKLNLRDIFIQNWFSQIENSSRGEFYGIFKREFKLESYLLNLSPYEREVLTKFRCCNLKLPIETGRWENIPRENSLCQLCNLQNIGNEYHYLFECTNVNIERLRLKYVPAYYRNNPNIHKMKGMIAICNINLLKKLSIFLRKLIIYI